MSAGESDAKKSEKILLETTVASSCDIIERILSRQRAFADPIVRNTLFVDKLCLVLDALPLTVYIKSKDAPPELIERVNGCLREINTELTQLFEWISSPQYGPDHAFGNNLMKEAEKDHDNKKDSWNK